MGVPSKDYDVRLQYNMRSEPLTTVSSLYLQPLCD